MLDLRNPLGRASQTQQLLCLEDRSLTYLLLNAFQRLDPVYGKAYREDISLRVRKRPKSVVMFLSDRIPET